MVSIIQFDLIQLLDSASPWALLTFGLTLVIADILFAQTEFLGWTGATIMAMGFLLSIGLPSNAVLYCAPFLLAAFIVLAKRFIGSSRERGTGSRSINDPVGSIGQVFSVNAKSTAEGRCRIPGRGEWSFRSDGDLPLAINDRVLVLRREGSTLIIEQISPPSSDLSTHKP